MEEHASQLVCPYANRPRGDLAMAVQFVLVAVLATVAASSALACTDDNVRGAAFNVPRDVHRLCLFARENDALGREHFARLARWFDTEGKDFNVQLEWVVADDPNTNWADYGLPSAPPTMPVTALIGCDTASGRAFIIDHWDPAPTDAELSVLAHSPAREAIHRGVLDCWAVLLHVPGAEDHARPREVLDVVAAKWSSEYPPGVSIVRIARDDPRERLLLSFIGLDPAGADWAGVVFGNGRMMAPPLIGPEITEAGVSALLDALRTACTCLQSPERLGVDIPMIWKPDWSAQAASLLAPNTEVSEAPAGMDAEASADVPLTQVALLTLAAVAATIALVSLTLYVRGPKTGRNQEDR